MTTHGTTLPPYANEYLVTTTGHHPERLVVLLDRWLARESRSISDVTEADVRQFLERPAQREITVKSRSSYRYELRRHLSWLAERGLAGPFDAEELEGYHRKTIPEIARAFLQHLAATRRPGTVTLYRYALRRFHDWLGAQGLELTQVDRMVCQRYAQSLHEAGLHPATRVGLLVDVRKYLDWLWERSLGFGSDHGRGPAEEAGLPSAAVAARR